MEEEEEEERKLKIIDNITNDLFGEYESIYPWIYKLNLIEIINSYPEKHGGTITSKVRTRKSKINVSKFIKSSISSK